MNRKEELRQLIEAILDNRGKYYMAYGVEHAGGRGAYERSVTVMEIIDHHVAEVIGPPCPSCDNNEQDNPDNWCEHYHKWVEQRKRAGLNE